ncbi:MAG: thioredoxin family protein [Lentisphaeria bacterium]|nr:thioredoxin family protein [Lentisphaeria bacterium]
MKSKLLLFTIFLTLGSTLFANDGWMTDYKAALEKAKKENKKVLLNFSGSDWCGWCIKLDSEVFDTQVFKDYAKDNLILVFVDFPRAKPQAEELKKQNEQLAAAYRVSAFPTIVIAEVSGQPIKYTGYQSGGPEKYVEHIKQILNK